MRTLTLSLVLVTLIVSAQVGAQEVELESIVVNLDQDGIYVVENESRIDLSISELTERVVQALARQADQSVVLTTDANVSFDSVAGALDALQRAGATQVGLRTL